MIRGNKTIEYGEDIVKIKFESDDDLPFLKILSIPVCIIMNMSIKMTTFKIINPNLLSKN